MLIPPFRGLAAGGLVFAETTNGRAYKIVFTNGVLGTEQVL